MNMPFELGVEYGCRRFGASHFSLKRSLILVKEQHDFRKALSDLSGMDVKNHGEEPVQVVRAVRDWLVETAGLRGAPSRTVLWYRFAKFADYFYDARKAEGFSDDDLNMMPIPEYLDFIRDWVSKNPI